MMNGALKNQGFLTHSETWIGVVLLIVGLTAAIFASDFDAISRTYPLTLGLVLAALGLVLIAKVLFQNESHISFKAPAKVALFGALILSLWVSALSFGLGYLFPTFVMEVAFLILCGVRGPARIILYAALISGISYLVFAVGLNVRLPDTLLTRLM